jgi:hypothetical protein
MSLESYIGSEQNLLAETPRHCHMLKLSGPILTEIELEKIRQISVGDFRAKTLPMLFDLADGGMGLGKAMESLCQQASQAVREGYSILILSDRCVDAAHVPIPSLLATSGVHHHLVREGTRTKVGLVVESGEAREVMHLPLTPILRLKLLMTWCGKISFLLRSQLRNRTRTTSSPSTKHC